VDGEIYAQVLVADGIAIGATPRAVALVATMQNSLYAFDADASPEQAVLWRLGEMRELGTPGFCARNVGGPNGILSTPVIDKVRQSAFVVARDCDPDFPADAPSCEHRLFEIALATGRILQMVTITGAVTVPTGDAGAGPVVLFEPSVQWNRPALLLVDGGLYVAFGSGPAGDRHEEEFVYHGWLFRYRASDLDQLPEVYCTTPRGRGGSVWQAGVGPAADEQGVYLTGANGILDDGRVHPPAEWPLEPKGQEDSVIRLPQGRPFPRPGDEVIQYWDARPYRTDGNVFRYMESGDNGFGSSGPMLIPGTKLLLVGSKAGLVYLLDRETLVAAQEPLSPFTELPLQPGHTLYLHSWWGIPVITQSFVYWRPWSAEVSQAPERFGYAFAWASQDRLRSLRFDYDTGRLEAFATADVPAIAGGGNLVLSANGSIEGTALLWAATRSTTAPEPAGHLWALDPKTLNILWRTDTPAWSKFTPPTVVRGRVFLPSTSTDVTAPRQVLVYGL
jgi:hypothetical protein